MKTTTVLSTILMSAIINFGTTSAFAMGQKLPGEFEASGSVSSPAPAPSSPSAPSGSSAVTPLWESKISGSKAWTAHLGSALDTLGKDLLDVIPADSANFCGNYQNLSYEQRKQVWIYLISYMAKFESSFNTNSAYTEDFADSSGKNVVSRGLLQISIESGNAYGCNFKSSADLHDPYQNLNCGVRILNRWMERDGRIAGKVNGSWKGGARYWSVLRTTSKSYSSIVSGVNALKICQK